MDTLIRDTFHDALRELCPDRTEYLRVKNRDAFIAFEEGRVSEDWYLENFFRPGASPGFTAVEFRDRMLVRAEKFPGIDEFLRDARDSGWKLFLASNYSEWVIHHLKYAGWDNFFDYEFVSFRMGVRKPDPGFFRMAISMSGIPADQYLFVDDRPENLMAARGEGMQTLQSHENWVHEARIRTGL